MAYAKETTVPVEKSRIEIEKLLDKFGCDQIGMFRKEGRAVVMFRAEDRTVRFVLPLPSIDDYKHTETGRSRSAGSQQAAFEQGSRSAWRALLLCIKAKLESIESGIETFEEAFLAHVLLPGQGNTTVGEWLTPQLEEATRLGSAPEMLAIGPG